MLIAVTDPTLREGGASMSKRLVGYDYSQPGFYFVTICTQQHRLVFGTMVDGQVHLRGPGQIAQSVWVTLPRRFAHVKLDEYVFMPNHMHAIIELTDLDPTQAGPRAALLSPRHFLVDSRPKVANWEQSVKVDTGTFSRWHLSTTAGMEL